MQPSGGTKFFSLGSESSRKSMRISGLSLSKKGRFYLLSPKETLFYFGTKQMTIQFSSGKGRGNSKCILMLY
jgi:hypothetical protein